MSYIVKKTETLEDLLFDKFISENYNHSFSLDLVNKKKLQKILKRKSLENFIFETSPKLYIEYYNSDEIFIILSSSYSDKECSISVFSKTLKELNLMYVEIYEKSVKELLMKEDILINFTTFNMINGALVSSTNRMDKDVFEDISPDFYPFLNTETFVEEFISKQENILVLSGDTGVGKTKFASLILKLSINKYDLLNKTRQKSIRDFYEINGFKELNIAYLKNEDILSSDQFWNSLKQQQFDYILLDDLDYMISPRKQNVSNELEVRSSKFVSQLLSFTDGIIANNTKFILTSNKESKEIDKALMRSGRMFDILSFRQLSYKEAFSIFKKNIKGKDILFENEFKSRDKISQADLGSFIHLIKINGKKKSYLKEKDISILNISKEEKKAGFVK